MTVIINGLVYRNGKIEPESLAFENGKIVSVPAELPENTEIIDAKGRYVVPGFIDIHTHGGGGHDFMDNTPEAFCGAAKMHAQHGTTTIIPTATSGTFEETKQMLEVFRSVKGKNDGADMPGIHFEGPYFNMEQRGAQDPAFIRAPKPEEYLAILEAGKGDILRWSAAPELEGSAEFAKALRQYHVLAAIGHSNADYDEVKDALTAGFTHITHLYSCMSTVHRKNAYRYSGIVESAYLLDDLTVEIIADGTHLPASLLEMVYRFIGPDRVALCTDSMRGAGMPDGEESIIGSLTNGQKVIIEDRVAKLLDRSAFAGSVATTDWLVKNMCLMAGASLEDSLKMMTETPAKIMGFTDRGKLNVGLRADIVLMDKDFFVSQTIVGGKTVWKQA